MLHVGATPLTGTFAASRIAGLFGLPDFRRTGRSCEAGLTLRRSVVLCALGVRPVRVRGGRDVRLRGALLVAGSGSTGGAGFLARAGSLVVTGTSTGPAAPS